QIPLGIRIPHHAIEVTHAQGVAVALRGVRADSGAQEVRLVVAFGTQRARLRALREQRDAALAGALAELRNVGVRLVVVRDRAVVVRADIRRLVLVAVDGFERRDAAEGEGDWTRFHRRRAA